MLSTQRKLKELDSRSHNQAEPDHLVVEVVISALKSLHKQIPKFYAWWTLEDPETISRESMR